MHEHTIDHRLMECTGCHATAEQIENGELAHPGKPTSERLWELVFRLRRMVPPFSPDPGFERRTMD